MLLSLLQQLPQAIAAQGGASPPEVSGLAACLASLPKQLPPDASAKLLEVTTAHGQPTLQSALQRSDVTALLLGVLCCPGVAEAHPSAIEAFYGVLLPIAATAETPWALLNALLPVTSSAHATLLQKATAGLQPDGMAQNCKAAHGAFGARLEKHLASLAA